MNYFFTNLIKGGANISLFNNQTDLSHVATDMSCIEKRATEKNIQIEHALKKHLREQLLGQAIVFILCVSFVLLAVMMVQLKIPDIYAIIPIVFAGIVFFGPKVIVINMNNNQKETT